MNPQSSAQYDLLATFHTLQSCTASPSNYTFIGCGPGPNFNPTNVLVNVTDDGLCSFGAAKCKFDPANVTINVGDTVEWHNVGKLNHTITFRSGPGFGFSLILTGNSSRQFFFPNYHYQTFDIPGNYSYFDTQYAWMTGNVVVRPLPTSPRIQEINATGPVGWTLIGLDQRAVLNFNHALTITSDATGSRTTKSNESGTFEETIDLAGRDETSGLASQFQYLPSVFPIQWLGTLGYPYNYYYQPRDIYTIWWVNGPLTDGSTVQLLTSVASIQGSGSYQVGAQALQMWNAKSDFVESYNQTGPGTQTIVPIYPGPIGPGPIFGVVPVGSQSYPQYFIAGESSSVSISLGYGQQSDLLFQASVSLRNYNKQVTEYPQGYYIYPYNPYPYSYGYPISGSKPVNVTNISVSSVSLSLRLTNTNLDLSKRMMPSPTTSGGGSNPSTGGGSNNPTSNQPASMMAWEFTAGAIVATAAGLSVWLALRFRRKPLMSPLPTGVPPVGG